MSAPFVISGDALVFAGSLALALVGSRFSPGLKGLCVAVGAIGAGVFGLPFLMRLWSQGQSNPSHLVIFGVAVALFIVSCGVIGKGFAKQQKEEPHHEDGCGGTCNYINHPFRPCPTDRRCRHD